MNVVNRLLCFIEGMFVEFIVRVEEFKFIVFEDSLMKLLNRNVFICYMSVLFSELFFYDGGYFFLVCCF